MGLGRDADVGRVELTWAILRPAWTCALDRGLLACAAPIRMAPYSSAVVIEPKDPPCMRSMREGGHAESHHTSLLRNTGDSRLPVPARLLRTRPRTSMTILGVFGSAKGRSRSKPLRKARYRNRESRGRARPQVRPRGVPCGETRPGTLPAQAPPVCVVESLRPGIRPRWP